MSTVASNIFFQVANQPSLAISGPHLRDTSSTATLQTGDAQVLGNWLWVLEKLSPTCSHTSRTLPRLAMSSLSTLHESGTVSPATGCCKSAAKPTIAAADSLGVGILRVGGHVQHFCSTNYYAVQTPNPFVPVADVKSGD
jgi:hypothetical protein